MPLDQQVRVRGRAEVVSDEEADAYFATTAAVEPDQRVGVETITADARLF